jgi:hypothetical protein
MTESRVYGVSTGNGNDGVSHIFANYYVKTDSPWLLAHCAVLSEFKQGKGQEFAIESTDIDGESDYTITATIYDPPRDEQDFPVSETESGKWIVDDAPDEEYDSEEDAIDAYLENDGGSWCDANGAWFILEVFPDDEPRDSAPQYDSIEDCFSAELVAMAKEWHGEDENAV